MDFGTVITMNYIDLSLEEYFFEFVDVFNWDVMLDKIVSKAKQNRRKKKLAISCAGDGLISAFDKLAHIVNEIEKQTHIRRENIVLIIGSMCVQSTFDIYNKCIQERGWPPLTLVIQNAWEAASASKITSDYDTLFDSSPRLKNKFMLFFNGEARADRGFMLATLIENNLLNRSYVSAYHTVDIYLNLWLTKGGDPLVASGLTPALINTLSENRHLFPIELSRLNYSTNASNSFHPVDDHQFFNDSYFSLVHETIYYDKSFIGSGHIPTLFLTEKTYKVIAAKHPFIVAQRPRILEALRGEGYKTFHPYIDESYDLIEDDVERLYAIKNEVLRLSTYSDEQWLEFQRNVKPIVDHNFAVLESRSKITYRVNTDV